MVWRADSIPSIRHFPLKNTADGPKRRNRPARAAKTEQRTDSPCAGSQVLRLCFGMDLARRGISVAHQIRRSNRGTPWSVNIFEERGSLGCVDVIGVNGIDKTGPSILSFGWKIFVLLTAENTVGVPMA